MHLSINDSFINNNLKREDVENFFTENSQRNNLNLPNVKFKFLKE